MKTIVRDLRKVPLIRILFPFAAGIAPRQAGWQNQGDAGLHMLAAMLLICLICYLITFSGKAVRLHGLVSLLLLFLSLAAGYLHAELLSPSPGRDLNGERVLIAGKLKDPPVPARSTTRITLKVGHIFNGSFVPVPKQHVRVYFRADTALLKKISPGDVLLAGGRLQRIANRGNPDEFDYAAYMSARKTWYTLFADTIRLDSQYSNDGYLNALPAKVAGRIAGRWEGDTEAVALLTAITLGNKSGISDLTREGFSDAGAMHLLAVSGLHVGMIWYMLNLLIRIPASFRPARIVKVLIIMGILWFYAGITGFSESVTRSVSMFTIVTLSTGIRRRPNIYNTLFLSALILLALKPSRISDAGFQLSYMAVLSIVTVQPQLKKWVDPKQKILKRITELVLVSIAAQVGTLPLTVYYFQQFPSWFILTNLVAIPLVSILLALFVIFSPALIAGWFSEFFSGILIFIADLLHQTVMWIAGLPGAVIEFRQISVWMFILILLLSIALTGFLVYRRAFFLAIALVISALVLLFGSHIISGRQYINGFYVYNYYNASVIGFRDGCRRLDIVCSTGSDADHFLQKYLLSRPGCGPPGFGHRIVFLQEHERQPAGTEILHAGDELWYVSHADRRVILCGRCDPRQFLLLLRNTHPDYVVFRSGFPFPDDITVKALQNQKIIADGTLRTWETERLKERLPDACFVAEQGAFTVESQGIDVDFR